MPFSSRNAGWRDGAFSLIEVVLALGIISFALVGIMGLFPVAMKSAQESQRETRATFIAQQVFGDLGSDTGPQRYIVSDSPTGSNATRIAVNLTAVATNPPYVIYFDDSGIPIGSVADPAAAFIANIGVIPNTPVAGLAKIEATIQTPASAASSNRASYTFVTLLKQN